MSDRRRQPKGIPAGGQFDANAHDEAGVALFGYGDNDPHIEEARSLNDELDAMWVDHQRFRLEHGAHTIRGGSAERTERERAIRLRLRELSEYKDGRGFEPYMFSTPKPVEYEWVDGDHDGDHSDHEYVSVADGARMSGVIFHRDRIEDEISYDIEKGVAAGSLSPLFDYEISFRDRDWLELSSITVTMTRKEGVTQGDYLNVLRAKTAPGSPEYSDRVRATVTRIRERLGAYNSATGARFEKPTEHSIEMKVVTDLPKLGDSPARR